MVKSSVDTSKDELKNMKTDNKLPLNEVQRARISDLADGQLRGDAFAQAMALLETSSPARAAWYDLHVVGDVLRGDPSANASNSAKEMAFLDAFSVKLAKEPALVSIDLSAHGSSANIIPEASTISNASVAVGQSANDSFFNWKWLGGLSAAVAVVALSWNLVGTTVSSPNSAGAQLAKSSVKEPVQTSSAVTQTAAGAMLRNPQLDALIAAHNQVSGSSALQMPSGFLRSATFNTDVTATVLSDK
jgi:sigma-E factor negative regulatory protein RseA